MIIRRKQYLVGECINIMFTAITIFINFYSGKSYTFLLLLIFIFLITYIVSAVLGILLYVFLVDKKKKRKKDTTDVSRAKIFGTISGALGYGVGGVIYAKASDDLIVNIITIMALILNFIINFFVFTYPDVAEPILLKLKINNRGSLEHVVTLGGKKEVYLAILDFCREPRLRKEICEQLGLSSQYIYNQYIVRLLDEKLLEEYYPDEINPRKQKYISNYTEKCSG